MCLCHHVQVGGREAVIHGSLPARGWQVTSGSTRSRGYGYLRYTGKAWRPETNKGVARGQRAHRVVMERLVGRRLLPDEHVHHQDFDKLNCCPLNLILLAREMNPRGPVQDPYTGERMTQGEFNRRYGVQSTAADSDVPDWVVN